MHMGEKLKQLRIGRKMTQQDLAQLLGVSKSVISYYESGDRNPSYETLVQIARIFHTTTDYLLDLAPERNLNVADLSQEDIDVLMVVSDALRRKNVKKPGD